MKIVAVSLCSVGLIVGVLTPPATGHTYDYSRCRRELAIDDKESLHSEWREAQGDVVTESAGVNSIARYHGGTSCWQTEDGERELSPNMADRAACHW